MNNSRILTVCTAIIIVLAGFYFTGPGSKSINARLNQVFDHEWNISDSDFVSIHALNTTADIHSEPFLSRSDVTIQWESMTEYSQYAIEIATDKDFTNRRAILTGERSPCRIPADVIEGGGQFYYRIALQSQASRKILSSPVRWFVVDPQLTECRVIPMGDHPNGKTESSPMVQDFQGQLHLVMQHDVGDTGRREIAWWISNSRGRYWEYKGRISRECDSFTGTASISASPDGRFLAVGYLGGSDARCPKPVVVCTCDLMQPEPCFSHYEVFEGSAGKAVRRPFLAVDEFNGIHVTWDGYRKGSKPVVHGDNEAYYRRCIDGKWYPVVNLSAHQESGFPGGTTLAYNQGLLYAIWCDGNSRLSKDYGQTWEPPLDQAPELIHQDYDINHGFKWWQLTTTAIPGTNRIAMVQSARFARDENLDRWTGWMNIRELYLSIFDPETGWSEPRSVYSTDAPLSTTVEPQPDQEFLRMERADIAADNLGNIYIAWDETTGIGRDRANWTRTARYLKIAPDGEKSTEYMLPAPGNLCSSKPLFSESTLQDGIFLSWFTGQMIPEKIRPYGARNILSLQGVSVAPLDSIQSIHQNRENLGVIPVSNVSRGNYVLEDFPQIPSFSMKNSSLATTYTPPPTPPPTYTPTPTPTFITTGVSTVADSTVEQWNEQTNYGYQAELLCETSPNLKKFYVKFPVPKKKAGQVFGSAKIKLHRIIETVHASSMRIGVCEDRWWEDDITFENQPEPNGWTFTQVLPEGAENIEFDVSDPLNDAWAANQRYISFVFESTLNDAMFDSKESLPAGSRIPVYLELSLRGNFGSSQSPAKTPTPGCPYRIFCPVRQDTYAELNSASQNFGNASEIILDGRFSYGFLEYWLPEISSLNLVAADLLLDVKNYSPASVESALNIYRITEPWNEDELTFSNRPGDIPIINDFYLERREGFEVIPAREMVASWLDDPGSQFGVRISNWDYFNADQDVQLNSREANGLQGVACWFRDVEDLVKLDLRLNQNSFSSGESFELNSLLANYTSSEVSGEFYCMLDVYGQYFFYPGWSVDLDYILKSYPAQTLSVDDILSFTWPDTGSGASGIKIWAAFLYQGLVTYDFVEFGWS